ncbi:MAG: decarboxylase, partial [Aeromonas sp.]|nr:decarboxylase [Aeromonas sp.]
MKLTELFTQPDPDFGQAMTALLETFHHSDDSQAPYQRDSFVHQLDQSSMPAIGMSTQAYLARLATLVPGASHLTSPHYMGHMTAPLPAFTAELSRLLVMLNQNPMKMESSRLLSFLEREVLAKLHRLVYREDDGFYEAQMHAKDAALGVMTSGGTIANVTALWLARNRACGDDLFSLYEQGYRGAVILG